MRVVTLVARVLLGLMFVVFGLNGFLHFIPMGPSPTGPAGAFLGAMIETHYVVPIFLLQLVCGVLFLVGRYVPLALTLNAPIIFNILLFHATMAPAGIGPGLLALILWIIVFYQERGAFAGIFRA